jgi:site-specific recombinase XerC
MSTARQSRAFPISSGCRSSLGCGRFRPARSRFRVKEPKRVPTVLSVDQVAKFWSGFRTARDLAIVGLMLLQGLRSKEVIALNLEAVQLAEFRICVHGKGNKLRPLPLASETVHLLDHYLRLERPAARGPALFVSLKGPARGTRITPAGLRSLFRYHRCTSGVPGAHPHRFRHTFASDMVRAGISLPALRQLMGHANISTTMIYVPVSPRDVMDQYARVAARRLLPVPPVQS